jgi:hypothetical protein
MKILRNLLMMAVLATAASVSQAGTARVESPASSCVPTDCNYFDSGACSGFPAGICSQVRMELVFFEHVSAPHPVI